MEKDDEEYDIVIPEGATFRLTYSYMPYSYWRIVEILNIYYNAHLVCKQGYKEGRYPGYRKKYSIVDNDTGRIIRERICLDELRIKFAKLDYPLHEPETIRNQDAEEFLRIVNNISASQSKEQD